jgi:hypothetical protein
MWYLPTMPWMALKVLITAGLALSAIVIMIGRHGGSQIGGGK